MSTLEERKQAFAHKYRGTLWDKVKEARLLKLTEDFEYRDAMFQADEDSVRNMQVRLAGLPNGKIITWLDSQNNPHNFSDGDLESMLGIIGDRGDHIYAKSWETKDLIMSIDDPLNFDAVAHFKGLL